MIAVGAREEGLGLVNFVTPIFGNISQNDRVAAAEDSILYEERLLSFLQSRVIRCILGCVSPQLRKCSSLHLGTSFSFISVLRVERLGRSDLELYVRYKRQLNLTRSSSFAFVLFLFHIGMWTRFSTGIGEISAALSRYSLHLTPNFNSNCPNTVHCAL